MANRGMTDKSLDDVYSTSNQEATLAIFEANANISRGVSYTKPRTITLDTKFDGVVGVNVWTGYAINVVSKTGKREVVVGPQTRLLDYDETLEAMELSTGRPKTTDYLLSTAYLRVENNKISDLINVQTKDFVDVHIKVSYCVDFLEEYKSKWFSVENYVKYLCDRQRSLLKREAKQHNIEDFYANVSDIVRKIALDINENKENTTDKKKQPARKGRLFKENGMLVHDVEVLSVSVESNVARILNEHQEEMIRNTLELSDAEKKNSIAKKLAEYEKAEAKLKSERDMYRLELKNLYETKQLKNEEELAAAKREQAKAAKQAEADLQALQDAIHKAKLARDKAIEDTRLNTERQMAEIEKNKQKAYAETVEKIMGAISEDLVAAMTAKANNDMLETVTKSMSPYAIAKGESIVDVTNKLLRGTSLEDTLTGIIEAKN
jgi:major vault protein